MREKSTNDKLIVTKNTSELNALGDEIRFLSYTMANLVPCEIVTHDENVDFIFETKGLLSCKELNIHNLGDIYRLLYNCANLYALCDEIEFSMSPENLMVDINLCPKVLVRDKKNYDSSNQFINMYKALSAALINPKYTYIDYLNGGADLFKKNKDLTYIYKCSDIEEIKEYFLKQYKIHCRYIKNKKVLVSKTGLKVTKVGIPILTVLLVVVGVFLTYFYVRVIPLKDTFISANESYMDDNYVKVQDVLRNVDMEVLPYSQKYILARSYIKTENLDNDDKETILKGISFKTDEKLLDYWIYIGKLDFDMAIDQAQRIGDDVLLCYAYIKQLFQLHYDTTMTGNEKTQKINEIYEKVNKLVSGESKIDTSLIEDFINILANNTLSEDEKDKKIAEIEEKLRDSIMGINDTLSEVEKDKIAKIKKELEDFIMGILANDTLSEVEKDKKIAEIEKELKDFITNIIQKNETTNSK